MNLRSFVRRAAGAGILIVLGGCSFPGGNGDPYPGAQASKGEYVANAAVQCQNAQDTLVATVTVSGADRSLSLYEKNGDLYTPVLTEAAQRSADADGQRTYTSTNLILEHELQADANGTYAARMRRLDPALDVTMTCSRIEADP